MKKKKLLLVLPLLWAGCVHLPYKKHAPPPPPLPEHFARMFAYERLTSAPRELLIEETSRYIRKHIIFSVPVAGGTNKFLTNEYTLPRKVNGKIPVELRLPISAGKNYSHDRFLNRQFARVGYATVMPLRDNTTKPKTKTDLERMLLLARQPVIDARHLLDWIETRPELDTSRIALLGTSRGALVGALLAAVDSRPCAFALVLPGCDLPYTLAYSRDGKSRGRGIARMRAHFLKELALPDAAAFERWLRERSPIDPRDVAPYAPSERVLLVLARFDKVVFFAKGWELRERMRRPETAVVPTGHNSAVLAFPYVWDKTLEFFTRKFGDAALAHLTPEQKKLVEKYERFKLKILLQVGLSPDASWEEIRVALAKYAGMPAERTTWDDILKVPLVQEALTEEKREAFATSFGLPRSAGWLAIRDRVDALVQKK